MVSKEYAKERLDLDDEEWNRLLTWYKKVTKGQRYFGAIGGEITFKICPTSIGEIIEAKYGKHVLTIRGLD